ncbi:MAG: nucleotidyltransferase domain-containing protein [Ignavibacteria bacterium]|nr:nucleotidyltransferase domain-containing protein [Ignavibacteria bacterium]
MYTKKDLIEIIREFIASVSAEFNLQEAYLFGSHAIGVATEFSDIDIALVSDDFEGSRFWDKKKLNKILLNFPSDIEIHPFNTEDFNDSDPFVLEIKRTGTKII